ncbi:divalent metal cation transporter [Dyella sp. KRB-257]|uniref:divalent metal cation transporter n=1 Tax=Dyella sp. KRB-257 TaxID=3400915 RepID=UPI003C10A14C
MRDRDRGMRPRRVVGAAVALRMLFRVPLWGGVLVSMMLMLPFVWLQQCGSAWLVGGVLVLLGVVMAALAAQLVAAGPDGQALLRGMRPDPRQWHSPDMLWLAAGIVGATIMPHNLYLHSSLTTPIARAPRSRIKRALRGIGLDSGVSLAVAMLVNVGLLVLAAAVFHVHDVREVSDLSQASQLKRIAPVAKRALRQTKHPRCPLRSLAVRDAVSAAAPDDCRTISEKNACPNLLAPGVGAYASRRPAMPWARHAHERRHRTTGAPVGDAADAVGPAFDGGS